MAEKTKPKKDKRMLTLFFLVLPSLLIAMTATIPQFVIRIAFQIVLLIFQIVIFKNFVDSYYGEDDNDMY